jgi:LPXTG-motif cell wall-anchored protein
MVKFRLVAAALIAGVVTLLSTGVAQAALYPDCGITLTLNNSTVVGGEKFSFTASAPSGVDCAWTVTYAGKTKTGNGSSISGSFSTEEVSKKTTTTITAKCTHELTNSSALSDSTTSADVTPAFYSTGSTATLQTAATRTCPVSAHVTLLPQGTSPEDDGVLPNTGGSNFWLLVLGGVLVIGGAGITYASRRRHTSR